MVAEPSHSTQDRKIADENWTEFLTYLPIQKKTFRGATANARSVQ